ncbi:hypothetical protein [Nonomuraea insulae]|uniref:Peptidase M61 catalytic domain-containing protein n=1 Tax=Nonomuraea insulae TaxID=1616787 RepID=A0ABW1CQY6_9ACTN
MEWQGLDGGLGVSSLGVGTVGLAGTVETLLYAFYMAGPVTLHPDAGTFSMHWLSEPPFDTAAVAARIERIYEVMCDFFGEPEPGHRVFVRKNPYPGNGGTALPKSFTFGWSEIEPPTVEELASLLAHETAHNWPRLDGEHGDIAWYTEGTAEYYSIVLPYRAGLIDEAVYLGLINERARGYYTNPLQMLSNAAAYELFWQAQRAQRVPYGRSLFYLADLDAKIRAVGDRSLDDLVLAVLERQRAGAKVGVDAWLALVVAELGEAARADFAAMESGEWVVSAYGAFGPGTPARKSATT